jgi:hypothetical protein
MMLILGVIGYPVWVLTLVATLAGLARVVGDNLMMSEPITFRGWVAAVRNRFGDSIKLGLLVIGLLFLSIFALFIALMIIGVFAQIVVMMVTALRLPEWGLIATGIVLALVALSGLFVVASAILARFVFLPQVVMIEGESPGIATIRARRLGAGNGFRVGAILIFSYFFMLSLFAALTLPLLVGLYFLGISTEELFTNPLLSVVYTAFQDISSLLALPLWSISFTLLYFDNRVRKEAYDVELLARDVAPGLHWQPTVRESAFGYQMAAVSAHERAYVQTSPLGLAGRMHYQREVARAERLQPVAASAPPTSDKTPSLALDGEAPMVSTGSQTESTDRPLATCTSCGTQTREITRFCSECGHRLNS